MKNCLGHVWLPTCYNKMMPRSVGIPCASTNNIFIKSLWSLAICRKAQDASCFSARPRRVAAAAFSLMS
ncbi:hypothetical protein ANT2_2574 [plant metagenome]|uniref:Uncharacterized protein n=1 Tax=plant metagenome TaxID=1297885 RepID=A0A484SBM9_9ZZZZ